MLRLRGPLARLSLCNSRFSGRDSGAGQCLIRTCWQAVGGPWVGGLTDPKVMFLTSRTRCSSIVEWSLQDATLALSLSRVRIYLHQDLGQPRDFSLSASYVPGTVLKTGNTQERMNVKCEIIQRNTILGDAVS